MANENKIKTRVQMKADTAENWSKAEGFTPLAREPIFYTDTGEIKLGDGETNVNDLPVFIKDFSDTIRVIETSAVSNGATAVGYKTIAGSKAFTITNLDVSTKTFTLDSVTDLKVGDIYSCHVNFENGSRQHENVGAITAISGNNVTVDTLPTYEATLGTFKFEDNFIDETGADTERNTFRIITKPLVGTRSIGFGAYTTGVRTKALSKGAVSFGQDNTSYGSYSYTEGTDTKAGYGAHAEGRASTASGSVSHAEGQETEASGIYSHSEGQTTRASGQGSHAEGYDTIASGSYAHAEGYGGYRQDINTGALSQTERAEAKGQAAHTEGTRTHASGPRSHAEGYATVAEGTSSHAEGHMSYAKGNGSHAEGGKTKAITDYAHSEGVTTIASGINGAHAEGNSTTAAGESSHAEGQGGYRLIPAEDLTKVTISTTDGAQALGDASHIEGKQTHAAGARSHAEGYATYAGGSSAHSEGHKTQAMGEGSHAEGGTTLAKAAYSHAEGVQTTASGTNGSHAEGYQSTASGQRSHAEGSKTTASNTAAHAEGGNTTASGECSHAEGNNTIASGKNQHVQGRYNVADPAGTYAHIVGGGQSGSPKNIHTLDWNGNATFAGDVYAKENKKLVDSDVIEKTGENKTVGLAALKVGDYVTSINLGAATCFSWRASDADGTDKNIVIIFEDNSAIKSVYTEDWWTYGYVSDYEANIWSSSDYEQYVIASGAGYWEDGSSTSTAIVNKKIKEIHNFNQLDDNDNPLIYSMINDGQTIEVHSNDFIIDISSERTTIKSSDVYAGEKKLAAIDTSNALNSSMNIVIYEDGEFKAVSIAMGGSY